MLACLSVWALVLWSQALTLIFLGLSVIFNDSDGTHSWCWSWTSWFLHIFLNLFTSVPKFALFPYLYCEEFTSDEQELSSASQKCIQFFAICIHWVRISTHIKEYLLTAAIFSFSMTVLLAIFVWCMSLCHSFGTLLNDLEVIYSIRLLLHREIALHP